MWAMIEKLRMWAWSATYLGYLSAPAHPEPTPGAAVGHPVTREHARARPRPLEPGQPLEPSANPSNQRPTPQTIGRPFKPEADPSNQRPSTRTKRTARAPWATAPAP